MVSERTFEMKILFYGTASYDKVSFNKELKSYPNIKIDFIETNLTPMTAALARGYDAVCAFVNADAGAMTLEILAGFGVKLVLMRCAGFDAVNVPVAKDLGMKVTRVPAYSPQAIAEHAMGLALCANRRIHKGYNRVRDNDFNLEGLVGETLYGKTAGIIGTGRIGAALCRICKGFGMKVIANSRHKKTGPQYDGIEQVSMEEIFKRSDVISIHCPHTKETENLLNREAFAKMKDGVIIINTARGIIIDEEALLEALESRKVYMAGLDVVANEPPQYQIPLMQSPYTFITSHIAWQPKAARLRAVDLAVKNFRSYLEGMPTSVIN